MKVNMVHNFEQYDYTLFPLHVELDRRGHEVVATRPYPTMAPCDCSVFNQNTFCRAGRKPRFYTTHGISPVKYFGFPANIEYYICPSDYWADEGEYRRKHKILNFEWFDMELVRDIGWAKTDAWVNGMSAPGIKEKIYRRFSLDEDKPLISVALTHRSLRENPVFRKWNPKDVVDLLLDTDSYNVLGTTHVMDEQRYRARYTQDRTGLEFMEIAVASDMLIGDSGSIIFEYCILGKPIVLLDNPDFNPYIEEKTFKYDLDVTFFSLKGFHDSEVVDMGPEVVLDTLIRTVEAELDNDSYSKRRKYWLDRIVGPADGKVSERFVDYMESVVE